MKSASVSLADITDLLTDGTHYTPPDIGAGIPFLTVRDISENGLDFENCSKISDDEYELAKRQNSSPRTGDILFSKDGTVGKVHLVRENRKFAVLSSLAILRPSSDVDAAYLAHFLRTSSALEAAGSKKTGSAIRRIVLRDLATLKVPLPPLDEQRRIAAILDKADALRRKRKRALDLLDGLAQSIFLEMFGARDDPVKELKDVVRKGTIVTYGIVQAGSEYAGGVPYIRTGDVVDGKINTKNLRHTDPKIASRFTRSRVNAGDIVMSIRATVGTTAVVPPELDGANLTQGTARIAPGDETRLGYLVEYLRSPNVQYWISRQIKGATFLEITLGRLRELPILVPPMELQEIFCNITKKINSHRTAISEQLAKANSLYSSLQYRAFSGQL